MTTPLRLALWALLLLPLLHSCKIADLRTSNITDDEIQKEQKALDLLDRAIQKQGFHILNNAEVYSIDIKDDWKGVNRIASPFPKDNQEASFRLRPGSFDGQFEYKEDPKERLYGVQSFQFYKSKKGQNPKFKKRGGLVFGQTAIQYLFELPLRLKEAEILKYAGSTELNGQLYELVFATWGSLSPNKEFDQYLLYLNKETGILEYASFTIRKPHVPAPKNIYGSIHYTEFTTTEAGISFPGLAYIYVNDIKETRKAARTVYFKNLELNSFELERLYPDPEMTFLGDSKPKG